MIGNQPLETAADRRARRRAVEDTTASEQPVSEEAINLNIQQRRARDVEEGRIVPGSGHVDIRSLMPTYQ